MLISRLVNGNILRDSQQLRGGQQSNLSQIMNALLANTRTPNKEILQFLFQMSRSQRQKIICSRLRCLLKKAHSAA